MKRRLIYIMVLMLLIAVCAGGCSRCISPDQQFYITRGAAAITAADEKLRAEGTLEDYRTAYSQAAKLVQYCADAVNGQAGD